MNSDLLSALSIGPFVLDYLRGSRDKGRVHSVFHRVINIFWTDGLWSISRSDVSNGPANVVTNLPISLDFTLYGIEPGTWVCFEKNKELLLLGRLSISLEKAAFWHPPLSQNNSLLPSALIKNNLSEVESWLRLSPRSPGLAKLFPHLTTLVQGSFSLPHPADPVVLLAGQSISRLVKGIYSSDRAMIEEGACSLIGLGPGLTPSGDDFLAGLLLSLTAAKRAFSVTSAAALLFAHKVLSDIIVEHSPSLTNEISSQMLFLASQGTGSELMENMVCALYYGLPKITPARTAQELCSVGASSGFDQLLGILLGAHLLVWAPSRIS
ncbi:Protein of unknown function (DUF2877) [Desulfitobacterium dehalogenans ATCC 51507]|uniref:DUF2877 domain-containing protein n=1 Tax=Desulfitobacterium dehalogenans (strain ATCC 51507 / DSM 9161 / JW/IU-DC1) TaxID=756499 RepID=I4A5J6_DESDJ|nr:DUF2877 domain-containing protein [Desulfitobacterium dehalogenans]AFL99230.1 Protein of unknown function (DUF2877) [Desulfitobacterium dehalogenans ATCC 51507]